MGIKQIINLKIWNLSCIKSSDVTWNDKSGTCQGECCLRSEKRKGSHISWEYEDMWHRLQSMFMKFCKISLENLLLWQNQLEQQHQKILKKVQFILAVF